jgi:L-ascorbate metabolism protein UlaG (beta-lactamase superfamily)
VATDPALVNERLDRLRVQRLAALFVAHSHYDHALDSAHVARRTGAKLFGSWSTLNIARGVRLDEKQMALYEPGRELRFGRFRVTVLRGKHSPPNLVNDDIGQWIDAPLRQPARWCAFKEGGSYNFLVRHGARALLIVPSANFVPGALAGVRVDALFLGTGGLGHQDQAFRDAYYRHTVGEVRPELVVPIHWDDFFQPLSEHLRAPVKAADNLRAAFEFLVKRTKADGIDFRVLQGYGSVLLFGP